MVKVSAAYRAAIVADSRRVVTGAIVEIISPDAVYGDVVASDAAPFAVPAQLKDKVMDLEPRYATFEHNAWILDGKQDILDPDNIIGHQGWASNGVSDAHGRFDNDPWVELPFSGVSILQACSAVFSVDPEYGLPESFTIAVYSGSEVKWSQYITDNASRYRYFTGFTVSDPTAVRVTIHRTAIPYRRPRVAEIIPGIYETWDGDDIVSMDIKQQGDLSCVTLPYGTMTLTMDNSDRRFDPAAKAGIFQSLEERQGIKAFLGVRLPDGSDELVPVGLYYQHQNGWKTGNNSMTMTWSMVDILGLLSRMPYSIPDTLPTTLDGWVASAVSQLGGNFRSRYSVDPSLSSVSLTVASSDDLSGITCGDLIRLACMAAGAWARAGNVTGDVVVSASANAGTSLTMDNLSSFPSLQANSDVAYINMTIFDGSTGTRPVLTVLGSSQGSGVSLTINNPFIHSAEQAASAAATILSYYGGNKINTTGRGDPASEIGDLDTVQINPTVSVTGLRTYQTFSFQGGILSSCKANFLAADTTAAAVVR